MIHYGRQDINDNDVSAVIDVLRSDFLTQGPVVPAFEASVSRYCDADYAVAVNSATSALHVACLALGVTSGDYVWTSPITFVASANCARYCGAKIDFVDIDSETYNISVDKLSDKLIHAEKIGALPKVLIPVHLCGQSCQMEEIYRLGKKYGFKIIEDASHAIGGTYQGLPVGNCRYSDITVFSFHPVKIVTTGEGGMALTNNSELARKMALLRSHGITRESEEMVGDSHGPWYYQQIDLGFNYRLTDIQAALGLSQMQRLDEFVARRRQLARQYDQGLDGLPITTPWQHPEANSAYHLYPVMLPESYKGSRHRNVFNALRNAGIGVNLHYIPVHLQPYYSKFGFVRGDYPQAESYYARAITLPLFPALSDTQQSEVIDQLSKAFH